MRTGSDIDSWCGRCKLILAHTIEAIAGGEIKRVGCNTCQAQHQYKPHAPGTAPIKARGSVQNVKPKPYMALLESTRGAEAVPYRTDTRYEKGSVLKHTLFGIGVVTADKGSNKIEVVFPQGPKTLVHGLRLPS
ncbi:MAG: hypothetical protein I8H75_02180 [Myxococcaceae bacterium]|nr:hypothetical protein [Myxococcaceae bacterium]MBH2006144.1 hypothetical protein [Myxococcaceae bacterium]